MVTNPFVLENVLDKYQSRNGDAAWYGVAGSHELGLGLELIHESLVIRPLPMGSPSCGPTEESVGSDAERTGQCASVARSTFIPAVGTGSGTRLGRVEPSWCGRFTNGQSHPWVVRACLVPCANRPSGTLCQCRNIAGHSIFDTISFNVILPKSFLYTYSL